jgi:hypothetical protein
VADRIVKTSAPSPIPLILIVLAGIAGMTASQEYWWLAPLISALALTAVVWFNWGQHKVKAIKLRHPYRAFLCYGPDDPIERGDIRLPANTQVMLQVRLRPTVVYQQLEIVFGFVGDKQAWFLQTKWTVAGGPCLMVRNMRRRA